MTISKDTLERLKQGWQKLNRLHALPIELERLDLIGEKRRNFLGDAGKVETLIQELGLNDEGVEEFPEHLHRFCGQGLRIWQYPNQFAHYLVKLSTLNIRSYMEIGVRHGGTFVTTVEYLEQFFPLDFAIAIDIIPCPAITEYGARHRDCHFFNVNSQADEFRERIAPFGQIDLVFIDSFHEEAHCRAEFNGLKEKTGIFAFHDISSRLYPGIGKLWQEVKGMKEYDCREYISQYQKVDGPYMGIGLAIRRDR